MSRSSENLPQHDEFLAGYLAGMDAGSALVGAGPPDEAILEPAAWPPPCYRALPLTYPQSFDPTASPDSTHLLSLDGGGWLPASDAVSNSAGDQPSLEPSPPQFTPSPLPALFGSPSDFSPSPGEGSDSLASRPATSERLPQDAFDVFAFPSTEPDMLVPPWAPAGAMSALQCASPNGQAADDKSPALDIVQYSRSSSRASVHVSPAVSKTAVSRKRGAPGSISQTVFRVYGTKRSRFNEQSRTLTAKTRELGACVACRKKKLRCDQAKEEFAPCGRCAKTRPHLLSQPCCRVEIIDVKLFRLGTTLDPLAILQQWMQSKQAAESTLLLEDESPTPEPPRKVQLTHDVCTTTFEVTIARYQPGPGDTTGYSWTDEAGCKRTYELPPYYISDLGEAARNLRHYIWEAKAEFTRALLVGSNPVVLKTFKEAERYHVDSNSELVADALMLWSATRMIERFWLITGDDMLGLPPMKQSIGPCRFNPYIDAAVPVTPIMDTQLDEIAIKDVLVPLKARLLTLLKKKVLEKKKENWYEIFLAIFIILHNSEIVLGQVMDYSRRYGISFASRSNDESSLSHAYYHACKTVLAYFHFASGGAAPLSLDWVAHNTDTSIMSQSQIAFLCDLKEELERQNDKLQGLKTQSMYDTEMFWCHQMLFANWKADMPYSGKFLACTEKDFLLS